MAPPPHSVERKLDPPLSTILKGAGASTAATLPTFMAEFSTDHPEIAARVTTDVPRWCKEMDEYLEKPGLARALLDHMKYFSRRRLDLFLTETANEVTTLLRTNPHARAIFLHVGHDGSVSGGSGKFLYEQCVARIPEELRERVTLLHRLAVDVDVEHKSARHDEYFILDDSANSGQQLSGLMSPARHFLDGYKAPKARFPWSAPPSPLKIHLRILALTDHARELFVDRYIQEAKEKKIPLVIDSKGERMPEVRDVLPAFGIETTHGNQKLLNTLSTQKPPAILGFFAHRMQDNLPYAVSSPSGASFQGSPEPLFNPGRRIVKEYGSAGGYG